MAVEDGRLTIITINVPTHYLTYIRKIQEWGMCPSRSEYIRTAIKKAIEEDLKFIDEVNHFLQYGKFDEAIEKKTIKVPKDYLERNGIKVLRRLE